MEFREATALKTNPIDSIDDLRIEDCERVSEPTIWRDAEGELVCALASLEHFRECREEFAEAQGASFDESIQVVEMPTACYGIFDDQVDALAPLRDYVLAMLSTVMPDAPGPTKITARSRHGATIHRDRYSYSAIVRLTKNPEDLGAVWVDDFGVALPPGWMALVNIRKPHGTLIGDDPGSFHYAFWRDSE